REGALQLLKIEKNGAWQGFENTCFALLFLRRATFTGLSGKSPVTGAAKAVRWSFTTDQPPAGWAKPDFDDEKWPRGAGAFGKWKSGPVRTEWKTNDIWIRRSFQGDGKPATLYVRHDDAAELYLNGEMVDELTGFSQGKYIPVEVATLKGRNVVAAHCNNVNPSGVGILDVKFQDLGLRTERETSKPFLWWKSKPDAGVRFLDAWETKGPFVDKKAQMIWAPVAKSGSWRKVSANAEGYVALRKKERSIAYARTTITVTRSVDAVLWVGADDGFAVVLDGKTLFVHHAREEAKPDRHAISLRLAKGRHALVLKIVNGQQETGFFARLTDRSGKTLK
ncbi:MAG: hypothetical protein OER88_03335, partial [Planctomycetota bacterium]|nr:hypothetical protein [Planctomycetota bacterium]